jgi:putative ABC transport system ATP-binding protein
VRISEDDTRNGAANADDDDGAREQPPRHQGQRHPHDQQHARHVEPANDTHGWVEVLDQRAHQRGHAERARDDRVDRERAEQCRARDSHALRVDLIGSVRIRRRSDRGSTPHPMSQRRAVITVDGMFTRRDNRDDRSGEQAIRLEAVSKVYGRGAGAVQALRGVSIALPHRSFIAVMGPSGSGKSTLLQLAAGLDRPARGRAWIGTVELSKLSQTRLTELRRDRIGFVFQAFNLLPSLTVEQNVTLPLRLAGRRADARQVAEVLERVGLTERRRHRPAELSGGQQQRAAIARALITRPEVLFADEPTGALDLRSGRQVLGLFRELVDTLAQTVVMVTHDPVAASYADSVLFLADGRLVDRLDRPTAEAVAERMTTLTGAGAVA